MVMRVIWDDDASEKLVNALEYGRDTFGERMMKKFYARILDYEKLLQSNPRMGKKEPLLEKEPEGYRSIVVHQNYKLVYYIEDENIYIVDLWDTRREPLTQADNVNNI